MSLNCELTRLHSILEDLSIYVMAEDFSEVKFKEKVRQEFNNVCFRSYKGLSRQAFNMLTTYCSTKETANYVITQIKGLIVPV